MSILKSSQVEYDERNDLLCYEIDTKPGSSGSQLFGILPDGSVTRLGTHLGVPKKPTKFKNKVEKYPGLAISFLNKYPEFDTQEWSTETVKKFLRAVKSFQVREFMSHYMTENPFNKDESTEIDYGDTMSYDIKRFEKF